MMAIKYDILLIYPNIWPRPDPPLGIAYIASFLEAAGYKVRILDCTFFRGLSIVEEALKDFDPNIVGISCTTPLYPNAIRVADTVKNFNEEIWTVLGGVHPSTLPTDVIQEKSVDIAVIGEGEKTMYEICRLYPERDNLKKIRGVVFKKNNGCVITQPRLPIENLDELPFPARHLLPTQNYLHFRMRGRMVWALQQPATSIIASRGCPFNCTFCSSKLLHGRKIRHRSPENIEQEIELLKKDYKVKGVYFHDDTLTANKQWLFTLCNALKRTGVEWICSTRVDLIDKESLIKMKNSGCSLISYGVESGNQNLLDKTLKKGITLSQVRDAFKLTSEAGIASLANFMLGLPGENAAMMQETISFSKRIGADVVEFSIYTPLPGTELYWRIKQEMGCINEEWSSYDYATPILDTPELPAHLVKEFYTKADISFYLRFSYVIQQLRRIKHLNDLKKYLRALSPLIIKIRGRPRFKSRYPNTTNRFNKDSPKDNATTKSGIHSLC